METFSALLAICAGNSPVTGEFPAQRPVTRSFDVFFVLRPNKRLNKQSWGWWFETPQRSIWRDCNGWVQALSWQTGWQTRYHGYLATSDIVYCCGYIYFTHVIQVYCIGTGAIIRFCNKTRRKSTRSGPCFMGNYVWARIHNLFAFAAISDH